MVPGGPRYIRQIQFQMKIAYLWHAGDEDTNKGSDAF